MPPTDDAVLDAPDQANPFESLVQEANKPLPKDVFGDQVKEGRAKARAAGLEAIKKTAGERVTGLGEAGRAIGGVALGTGGTLAAAVSKGAAMLIGHVPPVDDPGTLIDPEQQAMLKEYTDTLKNPSKFREMVKSSPFYQAGQTAEETYLDLYNKFVPVEERETRTSKTIEAIAGLPAAVTGRFAPFLFGLMGAGEHFDADYEKAVKEGKTKDEAAEIAGNNSMKSMVSQMGLWTFAPGALHKFVGAKIASRVGQNTAERWARNVATGAVTLGAVSAASHVGEQAISGKPVTANLGEATLGGAIFGGVVGGFTARPMLPKAGAPAAKPGPAELGARKAIENIKNIFGSPKTKQQLAKEAKQAATPPVVYKGPKERRASVTRNQAAVAPATARVVADQFNLPLPPPSVGEEKKAAELKAAKKGEQKRAVQEQKPDKEVLRSPQPELGLPQVGPRDKEPQEPAPAQKPEAPPEQKKVETPLGETTVPRVTPEKAQAISEENRPGIKQMPDEDGNQPIIWAKRKEDGTWQTHNEIIAQFQIPPEDIDRRIFGDAEGKEKSRETTAEDLAKEGVTTALPGMAHSTDVNAVIETAGVAKPEESEVKSATEGEPTAEDLAYEKEERAALEAAAQSNKEAGLTGEVRTMTEEDMGGEPFSKGKLATVTRQGHVVFNPEKLRNIIKGAPEKYRQRYINSIAAEEGIHGAARKVIRDKEAESLWKGITAKERAITEKEYLGQDYGKVKYTDAQMGHEYLRRAMQRLGKMDVTEVIEARARKEHWVRSEVINAIERVIQWLRSHMPVGSTNKQFQDLIVRLEKNIDAAKGGEESGVAPAAHDRPREDEPRSADDFIAMPPERFVSWKKKSNYGPGSAEKVAAAMTQDDLPKLQVARDQARAETDRLGKELESAYNAKDEDRANEVMAKAGQMSLKAQTLNEIADELAGQEGPAAHDRPREEELVKRLGLSESRRNLRKALSKLKTVEEPEPGTGYERAELPVDFHMDVMDAASNITEFGGELTQEESRAVARSSLYLADRRIKELKGAIENVKAMIPDAERRIALYQPLNLPGDVRLEDALRQRNSIDEVIARNAKEIAEHERAIEEANSILGEQSFPAAHDRPRLSNLERELVENNLKRAEDRLFWFNHVLSTPEQAGDKLLEIAKTGKPKIEAEIEDLKRILGAGGVQESFPAAHDRPGEFRNNLTDEHRKDVDYVASMGVDREFRQKYGGPSLKAYHEDAIREAIQAVPSLQERYKRGQDLRVVDPSNWDNKFRVGNSGYGPASAGLAFDTREEAEAYIRDFRSKVYAPSEEEVEGAAIEVVMYLNGAYGKLYQPHWSDKVEALIKYNPEILEIAKQRNRDWRDRALDFAQEKMMESGLDGREAQAAVDDWPSYRNTVYDKNPGLAVWIDNTIHPGYQPETPSAHDRPSRKLGKFESSKQEKQERAALDAASEANKAAGLEGTVRLKTPEEEENQPFAGTKLASVSREGHVIFDPAELRDIIKRTPEKYRQRYINAIATEEGIHGVAQRVFSDDEAAKLWGSLTGFERGLTGKEYLGKEYDELKRGGIGADPGALKRAIQDFINSTARKEGRRVVTAEEGTRLWKDIVKLADPVKGKANLREALQGYLTDSGSRNPVLDADVERLWDRVVAADNAAMGHEYLRRAMQRLGKMDVTEVIEAKARNEHWLRAEVISAIERVIQWLRSHMPVGSTNKQFQDLIVRLEKNIDAAKGGEQPAGVAPGARKRTWGKGEKESELQELLFPKIYDPSKPPEPAPPEQQQLMLQKPIGQILEDKVKKMMDVGNPENNIPSLLVGGDIVQANRKPDGTFETHEEMRARLGNLPRDTQNIYSDRNRQLKVKDKGKIPSYKAILDWAKREHPGKFHEEEIFDKWTDQFQPYMQGVSGKRLEELRAGLDLVKALGTRHVPDPIGKPELPTTPGPGTEAAPPMYGPPSDAYIRSLRQWREFKERALGRERVTQKREAPKEGAELELPGIGEELGVKPYSHAVAKEAARAQQYRQTVIDAISQKMREEARSQKDPREWGPLKPTDVDYDNSKTTQGAYKEFKSYEMQDFGVVSKAVKDRARASDESRVSVTKRLLVLENKSTRTVDVVSAFPAGKDDKGKDVIRVYEPTGTASKPNRDLEDIMKSYLVRATILRKDPVQDFHERYPVWSVYWQKFGKKATREAQETLQAKFIAQENARDAALKRGAPPDEMPEELFPRPDMDPETARFFGRIGDEPPPHGTSAKFASEELARLEEPGATMVTHGAGGLFAGEHAKEARGEAGMGPGLLLRGGAVKPHELDNFLVLMRDELGWVESEKDLSDLLQALADRAKQAQGPKYEPTGERGTLAMKQIPVEEVQTVPGYQVSRRGVPGVPIKAIEPRIPVSPLRGLHLSVINALDKMHERVLDLNPDMTEDDATAQVLDMLYDALKESEFEYEDPHTGHPTKGYSTAGFIETTMGWFAPKPEPGLQTAPVVPKGGPTITTTRGPAWIIHERPESDPERGLVARPEGLVGPTVPRREVIGPEAVPIPPRPQELAMPQARALPEAYRGALKKPEPVTGYGTGERPAPEPMLPDNAIKAMEAAQSEVEPDIGAIMSDPSAPIGQEAKVFGRPPVMGEKGRPAYSFVEEPKRRVTSYLEEPEHVPPKDLPEGMYHKWDLRGPGAYKRAQKLYDDAKDLTVKGRKKLFDLIQGAHDKVADDAIGIGQAMASSFSRNAIHKDIYALMDGHETLGHIAALNASTHIKIASLGEPPPGLDKMGWEKKRKVKQAMEDEAKKVRAAARAVIASRKSQTLTDPVTGLTVEAPPILSKDQLVFLRKHVSEAMGKARTALNSPLARDRRKGRAWMEAARKLEQEINYADEHWAPPWQGVVERINEIREDNKTFLQRVSNLKDAISATADEKVRKQLKARLSRLISPARRARLAEELAENMEWFNGYANGAYDEKTGLDPILARTVQAVREELQRELAFENDNGFNVTERDNYLPGRYDAEFFNDDRIMFGQQRILGKQYRKPKSFANHYEAIKADAYLPASYDTADIVQHRVSQGRYIAERRVWADVLKKTKDPISDKAIAKAATPIFGYISAMDKETGEMVTQRGITGWKSPDPEYEVVHVDGQKPLAVRMGYKDAVLGATARSAVRDRPAGAAALQFAGALKSSVLLADIFHPTRLWQYATALGGNPLTSKGRAHYQGGYTALAYRAEDMPRAVELGLIDKRSMDWAKGQVPGAKPGTTRQDLFKVLASQGLNAAKITDALYREAMRNIPFVGELMHKLIGPFNRAIFDVVTPGLIAESAVENFERMRRQRPDINVRDLARDVIKDTNAFYGNMGRQGVFSNPTFRDIAQIIFLAPMWMEGLLQKELRFYSRVPGMMESGLRRGLAATGLDIDTKRTFSQALLGRQGLPAGGTLGRAMARGLLGYFVMSQILNYIFRRHSTFENPEPNHKLDAFVKFPSWERGLWISPMSVFSELMHDASRLIETKPTAAEAIAQIGYNKLSPLGRAAIGAGTGVTSTGRKTTSTMGRLGEAAYELAPVPISLGAAMRGIGHGIGIGPPNYPGQMAQRTLGMVGIKAQIAESKATTIHNLAREFMKKQGWGKETGYLQQLTTEPSYVGLRQALRVGDEAEAERVYQELLKTHTHNQIYKAMRHSSRMPFTGSAKKEHWFRAELPNEIEAMYHEAVQEKLEGFQRFVEWQATQHPAEPEPAPEGGEAGTGD